MKTAVALLILPNIVMDLIQGSRHGKLVPTIQRFAVLVLFGAIGTVVGTRLLTAISSRTATLVLGFTVVIFVVLNATRWSPRVSPRAEPWADVPVGLAAGMIGGVTNVPGTPLVMYFYELGLRKRDFVRAVAVTFVLFKLAQLGAVAWFGLLTFRTLELSALLTLVAVLGFWLGVKIQDRLVQETFNRVVLVCLALLGVWLIVRAQM